LKKLVRSDLDCERMPVTRHSPCLTHRTSATPWVCESYAAPTHQSSVVQTVTHAQAMAVVLAKVRSAARDNVTGVMRSIDAEDIDNVSDGVMFDLELPAPASAQKQCDTGPDPFRDDDDDTPNE